MLSTSRPIQTHREPKCLCQVRRRKKTDDCLRLFVFCVRGQETELLRTQQSWMLTPRRRPKKRLPPKKYRYVPMPCRLPLCSVGAVTNSLVRAIAADRSHVQFSYAGRPIFWSRHASEWQPLSLRRITYTAVITNIFHFFAHQICQFLPPVGSQTPWNQVQMIAHTTAVVLSCCWYFAQVVLPAGVVGKRGGKRRWLVRESSAAAPS